MILDILVLLLDILLLPLKVLILTILIVMCIILSTALCSAEPIREVDQSIINYVYNTEKGYTILSKRDDGSIKSYREWNCLIEYDAQSELTSGRIGSMEFTLLPDTHITRCVDTADNIDIQIEHITTQNPEDTHIHYWGNLYGIEVDVTYKLSEREVVVNKHIDTNFEMMWEIDKAVKKLVEQSL